MSESFYDAFYDMTEGHSEDTEFTVFHITGTFYFNLLVKKHGLAMWSCGLPSKEAAIAEGRTWFPANC